MRKLLAAALLASVLLFASAAFAHAVNLSQSDFTVVGAHVHALVVFARPDALRLGMMDRNEDGIVTSAELEASREVWRSLVETELRVRADGAPCTPTLEGGGDGEGDGFGLSIEFTCPAAPRAIAISMTFLRRLLPGHHHVVRIQSDHEITERILTADDPSVEVAPVDASPSFAVPTPPSPAEHSALVDAIRLGIAHIFSGWDHLLFLLAILLGTRRLRSIIVAVSAFTVAHSMTLALAALGVLTPSPRLIEPAIAASIVYVAFENAWRPAAIHRGRIAFAFGLIHGFGFASALRALSMTRDRLVPTLFGFNVGVEIGQLIVVAMIVPVLALVFRGRARDAWPARALSIVVGLIAIVVFIARVRSPD